MTKKAADTTTQPGSLQQTLRPATVTLLFLDTSARLFIPSVGGTVLGVWADSSWGTKPWMTLIGVTLGTIIAFASVWLQIKSVSKASAASNPIDKQDNQKG